MRIISGFARGRKLASPGNQRCQNAIRPTSDRAREAIFNILGQDRLKGAMVLDLFAGTGALGLEALSRGACLAVFVDCSTSSLKLIAKNIEICGFKSSAAVIKKDLNKGLSNLGGLLEKARIKLPKQHFDLIFLDPPYEQKNSSFLLAELQDKNLINPNTIVVFEDRSKEKLEVAVKNLVLVDQRLYGDTGFWIYQLQNNVVDMDKYDDIAAAGKI